MGRLYLVRHATTDWNIQHRWQGIQDIPLNDNGIAQIELVAEAFVGVKIDRICASDLSRARDTAEGVRKATGPPLETHATLRERSFGRWEGHTNAELEVEFPDDMAAYRVDRNGFRPPGGQSWREFAEKAVGAVEKLAEKYDTERVAFVTHGGVIRAYINHVMGTERGRQSRFRIDNASVTIVDRTGSEVGGDLWWQVIVLNQTAHLNGTLPE